MRSFTLLLTSLMTLTITPTLVNADETIAVISPHQDSKIIEQQFSTVADSLYGMNHGDSLIVLNGEDGATLTVLKNPEHEAFISPKSRKKANKEAISAFKKALNDLTTEKRSGSLNLPRVLTHIARYHTGKQKSGNRNILLIGSPLFDAHPRYDMKNQRFPSDGHLLTHAEHSLFSVKDKKNTLNNARFHWWLTNPLAPYNYAQKVQRFFHLYLHHQGNNTGLVSFTHDTDTVFRLLKSKVKPLPMIYQLNTNSKVEMQSLHEVSLETCLYQYPISKTPPSANILNNKQKITLGIEWQNKGVDVGVGVNTNKNIDFDVYAKLPSNDALYFDNTSNQYGLFYKDIRSNLKKDNTAYETIHTRPIDISTLRIGVNLYSTGGYQPPVTGTLRVMLSNQVYARDFTFNVTQGNKGVDMAKVLASGIDSPYSHYFTIQDIINHSINHKSSATQGE